MSQLLQYYKSLQTPKNNQSTPTFEDLSIDDNLSELERVVRYCKSSIGLQRLVHVKLLSHVAKSVGYETTRDDIFPVLESLSVDMEPAIRCHLCEQLGQIAHFCVEVGGESGYESVLNTILPMVAQLLEDDKLDVRQAASISLVSIAQIVKTPDLGQHILTIILQLAHEDENEDMRMTASELLNLLAEHLGLDLCKQFVIPEVVSLAEDPVFRVRKSTALNFQNVCRVGGEYELFERLMPAFVRLSKDDMYRVRRACAESLCEISKHVSDDIRTGVLVEIFLRLAQDPSKLVKQSVLQQSGMFISTLPPRVINKVILDHYCSMVNNPTGDLAVDTELRHYCAYSFPGVLQTVGSSKWPELRTVYNSLVATPNPLVKKTLALSLHEVARILGTKLAEEDLANVFEMMISDSTEVVRMGIIKHLAEFLSLLSMPCRISYLPLLDEILKSSSPYNWRLRKSLASQLSSLVLLPPPSNVYSTLFPLAMTLLQDPVAEVRDETYVGVAKLILVLSPGYKPSYNLNLNSNSNGNGDSNNNNNNNDNKAEVNIESNKNENKNGKNMDNNDNNDNNNNNFNNYDLNPISEDVGTNYLVGISRAINSLTSSDTYQHRQLWAKLSLILLKYLPKETFETYFLHHVLKLTSDPVLNVRINIAEMLTGWDSTNTPPPWECQNDETICPWVYLLNRNDIKECIQRLAQDDHDVYLSIIKLKPLFSSLEFRTISCRGMKYAPGGVIPVYGVEKLDNHDRNSDDGHVSDGRISRSSSLSSHDENNISDISGQSLSRTNSSTKLASPVTIPNLGILRVDEVEFNLQGEMDGNFIDFDGNIINGLHLQSTESEDYDEDEEKRIILERGRLEKEDKILSLSEDSVFSPIQLSDTKILDDKIDHDNDHDNISNESNKSNESHENNLSSSPSSSLLLSQDEINIQESDSNDNNSTEQKEEQKEEEINNNNNNDNNGDNPTKIESSNNSHPNSDSDTIINTNTISISNDDNNIEVEQNVESSSQNSEEAY